MEGISLVDVKHESLLQLWRDRVMECRTSGKSVAVWCGENGINIKTYYYWQKQVWNIKTMINVGKTHDIVRVVNDQIGTPTYTLDLARLLVDMIETEKYGYYHATNSEDGHYISWYDFCCEFYKQYGLKTQVIPVTTSEYGLSKAARPFNSRLDKSKLVESGFTQLPDWKDAVKRYLAEAEL